MELFADFVFAGELAEDEDFLPGRENKRFWLVLARFAIAAVIAVVVITAIAIIVAVSVVLVAIVILSRSILLLF